MLRLSLGSSPRLGAVLAVGHIGALVVVVTLLPPGAAAVAAAVLGLGWLGAWRTHVTRSGANAVTGVEVGKQAVSLRRRDGRTEACTLVSRFATPSLVILSVRPAGRRCALPIVIAPEAVGGDAHRRLRVWLKWGRAGADNPGSA